VAPTTTWRRPVKLICIEEHAIDPAIARAAQPALQREAPYMSLQNSHSVAPSPGDRPSMVEMTEAVKLGTDLGEGRIRRMDEHGIDVQVVSYSTPAQLAPQEQAVTVTQAANNRLAGAIAANPTRLSGFAILPWQAPQAVLSTNSIARSPNSV
jgi:uncharacterized protein